ncbi:MAG: hypothetical protein E6J14_14900 [Chloroflexi bacterium]|nr:MAG: hypothetical protein E6J14_14900 [Chloroflexota bacterium]
MDETQLRLDGNAAAGLLQEVFVHELTSARGACASCGAVAEVGAQHLYMYPQSPGAVLRCSACASVLLVLVQGGGHLRLALPGFMWLEFREAGAQAG